MQVLFKGKQLVLHSCDVLSAQELKRKLRRLHILRKLIFVSKLMSNQNCLEPIEHQSLDNSAFEFPHVKHLLNPNRIRQILSNKVWERLKLTSWAKLSHIIDGLRKVIT